MKHAARAAAPILALALLTGCAGTPLRLESSALEDEVRKLRAQVVELQRQAAMSEVEIARLRQQVGAAGAAPAPRTEPARTATTPPAPSTPPSSRPQTQPQTQPQTAQPQNQARQQQPAQTPRTTPPVQPAPARRGSAPSTSGTRIDSEEIEEVDIDMPAPELVKPQTRPATPPPTTSPTTTATTASQSPQPAPPVSDSGSEVLSPTSQALYDRGYTLYHQGHFLDAEASFQRFLQGNPKSELADNAQYWIGECRYARGDMRGALAAFRETFSKFPEGNKVPDALLKAGQCLEALNDLEGARTTYREVSKRFPGTAAATVAEERRSKLP